MIMLVNGSVFGVESIIIAGIVSIFLAILLSDKIDIFPIVLIFVLITVLNLWFTNTYKVEPTPEIIVNYLQSQEIAIEVVSPDKAILYKKGSNNFSYIEIETKK